MVGGVRGTLLFGARCQIVVLEITTTPATKHDDDEPHDVSQVSDGLQSKELFNSAFSLTAVAFIEDTPKLANVPEEQFPWLPLPHSEIGFFFHKLLPHK